MAQIRFGEPWASKAESYQNFRAASVHLVNSRGQLVITVYEHEELWTQRKRPGSEHSYFVCTLGLPEKNCYKLPNNSLLEIGFNRFA